MTTRNYDASGGELHPAKGIFTLLAEALNPAPDALLDALADETRGLSPDAAAAVFAAAGVDPDTGQYTGCALDDSPFGADGKCAAAGHDRAESAAYLAHYAEQAHDCPREVFLDDPITVAYGVGGMVGMVSCAVCDAEQDDEPDVNRDPEQAGATDGDRGGPDSYDEWRAVNNLPPLPGRSASA